MKKFFANKVIMFIMFLLFFKPICFQYFSNLLIVDNLFIYGKILVALIIIFDTVISIYPKLKINRLTLNVLLFEIWILLVTLVKSGAVFTAIIDFVTILILVIMIQKFLDIDREKTLSVLKTLFFSLVVIQLISEVFFPSGMPADLYYNNSKNPLFFVTLDNGTTCLTCITLTLIFLCKKKNKKDETTSLIQVFICILTAVLSGSTTAIICTTILFLFIKLSKEKFMKIFDKWWLWFSIYLLLTALIITNNQIINNLIYFITGKSNFTGRTHLWYKAIEMIELSPIVGYGRTAKNYLSAWGGIYSSHNVILEMILQGGIICFILWLNILIKSFKNLKNIQNYKLKRLLFLTIFLILIALSMESNVHSEYLFLSLTITWQYANNKGGKHE